MTKFSALMLGLVSLASTTDGKTASVAITSTIGTYGLRDSHETPRIPIPVNILEQSFTRAINSGYKSIQISYIQFSSYGSAGVLAFERITTLCKEKNVTVLSVAQLNSDAVQNKNLAHYLFDTCNVSGVMLRLPEGVSNPEHLAHVYLDFSEKMTLILLNTSTWQNNSDAAERVIDNANNLCQTYDNCGLALITSQDSIETLSDFRERISETSISIVAVLGLTIYEPTSQWYSSPEQMSETIRSVQNPGTTVFAVFTQYVPAEAGLSEERATESLTYISETSRQLETQSVG